MPLAGIARAHRRHTFLINLLLEYALKKAKHDQPRQARRQAALDRFKILPESPGDTAEARAKYLARKDIELASLKSALGHAAK